MKLFSFGGTRKDLTLVFDIQSSVVRGALVEDISTSPSIIHSCIIYVPHRPTVGGSYLIKRTLKAISDVMEDMNKFIFYLDKKIYEKKIRDVHFVLSSPWISSQAHLIKVGREKVDTIDEGFIKDVLAEERKKMFSNDSSLITIEEKVFDIRLNGYSVAEWKDRRASSIEASYTSSYASNNIIEKFKESVSHFVHKSHIFFHSSLLLQYVGLKNIYKNEHANYCIVYLHGELTDTVVVKNGSPIFFGSFPFGVQTLVRKIARNTKTDVGTAESMLSLFVGDHVDEKNFESNANIIKEVTSGWKKSLTDILASQPEVNSSDFDIIVSSRTHEDFFISSIRQIYTRSRVQSLSSELVQSKVPFLNNSEHIRLLALYASAIGSIDSMNNR